MQATGPKPFRRKPIPKVPTSHAKTDWVHLDGDISAKDDVIEPASRRGRSRFDFDRHHAFWRKELRDEDDQPERCCNTLHEMLVDMIARQWADDPLAIDFDELARGDRIVVPILRRVEELCRPGSSRLHTAGAESVYLPFNIWSNLVLRLDDQRSAAAIYRGLVFQDKEELQQMAAYNRQLGDEILCRSHFLVLLDMSNTAFTDEDCKSLHLVVGSTLAALRLNFTNVTDSGVASLAMSIGGSSAAYLRLRYLSLLATRVSDKAVKYLAKFPRLAAIDLRNTHCHRVDLIGQYMATGWTRYHKATEAELAIFAGNLSLCSAHRRLCKELDLSEDGVSLAALVAIREVSRAGDYSLPSSAAATTSRGVFSAHLGHIHSTASLNGELLAEEITAARGPRAYFELGEGGVRANVDQPSLQSRHETLVKHFSDSEEVDATFIPGRQRLQALPPPSDPLLLFRRVRMIDVIPIDAKPDVAPLPAGPSLQKKEHCLARKSALSVEALLGVTHPSAVRSSQSATSSATTLPKPMSAVSSNRSAASEADRVQHLKRGAPSIVLEVGSKKVRSKLASFNKANFR